MYRRIPLLIFLFLIAIQVIGQKKLSGLISDKKTGKPIANVDVSIVNYSIGTTTNAEGSFIIKNIPASATEVLISHTSYKPILKKLNTLANGDLNVELDQEEVDLNEVTIVAKKDKKRKKQLKIFKNEFLGHTANSRYCEILNPEVITFTENDDGSLYANARGLIEIKNNSTGYYVSFLLESFSLKGNLISYSGKPIFSPIKAENTTDSVKWKNKREKTYLGSKTHFFNALFADKLFDEGFEISRTRLSSNVFYEVEKLKSKKVVSKEGDRFIVNWKGYLRVGYRNESDPFARSNNEGMTSNTNLGHPSEKDMIQQGSTPSGTSEIIQVSYLYLRKPNINVLNVGEIINSKYIVEYGYWNNERVADLLPFDYKEFELLPIKQMKKSVEINGFDVSNCTVPIEKIEHGGPGRDGISALIDPVFIRAEEAGYLNDDDLVLALEIDSISKAYPLKILNWHEVINDQINNQHFVVTFCPLCRSGIVFSSEIKGKKLSFGVSGLLYNNDVILYDRETESLWSQIEMMAISGQAVGNKLIPMGFLLDTWGNWKLSHSKTLVLSDQTGYDRDYNKNPYDGYDQSNQLMFKVEKSNDILPNKELVLGLIVNGKTKAYPYSLFKDKEGIQKDKVGGKNIEIEYQNNVLYVLTPGITAITLYWFAWYAFYPETELYNVE